MSLVRRRRGASSFERAASGEMTLLDHLRELRSRLFKAALSVTAGFVVGWIFADKVRTLLQAPYCDYMAKQEIKNFGDLVTEAGLQGSE